VAVVIKADCPGCGVVRLGAPDVTVRVCADDGSGAYTFQCPRCATAVSHPAAPDTCALLVTSGVRAVEWRWPDELERRPDGPPFTVDDLLDFHLLLRDDRWCSQLAGLGRGADSAT
jgi:hypothetical protein